MVEPRKKSKCKRKGKVWVKGHCRNKARGRKQKTTFDLLRDRVIKGLKNYKPK